MFLTGILTAGVSFGVYLYGLKSETPELARTHAFAALVFAELLRSFGARSETKPLWRIPLLTNVNLLLVVLVSFALQIGSHHIRPLAIVLKTSLVPLSDCLMLLGLSLIPVVGIEAMKRLRRKS
jgi:Ca2+-transporting ATPase